MTHAPDLSDDQFDTVLDAMVHGNHAGLTDLDPEMRSTVIELLDWATLSGFAGEAPAPPLASSVITRQPTDERAAPARNVPPESPIPIHALLSATRPRRASRRTIIMSTVSGLAAALILGLSLYGAIPNFTDRAPSPTTISLAGADGTHLADAGTTPTTASDSVIGSPGPNSDGVDPLSSDECTVTPIPRSAVISILQSPPGEYADIVNAKPMAGVVDGWPDAIPVDDLNAVFREWQACVKFGETWQYMALQTDYMTRSDIYGPQLLSRPVLTAAYSDATLNDLLSGREQVDADRQDAWLEYVNAGGALPENVLIIDQTVFNGIGISHDGTYIASVPIAKLNQANGEQIPRNGTVDFELVDGQWKIARVDPWLEF
ncbi:MAG: hypothetical protein QM753_00645 [Thermomicrobiales bacterium]